MGVSVLDTSPCHGAHESDERKESNDGQWCICVGRRVYWSEGQTSERVPRSVRGACCFTAQNIWIFQAWWHDQHEAENQTRKASKERRKPVYQRALRLQSEACLKDRQSPPTEEVQGDDQLSIVGCE